MKIFNIICFAVIFSLFSNVASGQSNLSLNRMLLQIDVAEATGEADLDTNGDLTAYTNILTVTAPASGLIDCTIDIDFDQDTTGWNDVATHDDLLDCVLVKQIDGTNYRSTQMASAQITSAATLTSATSGVSFRVGPMQANASVQVHCKVSAERGDSAQPYRVTYIGEAPTITPVAANDE